MRKAGKRGNLLLILGSLFPAYQQAGDLPHTSPQRRGGKEEGSTGEGRPGPQKLGCTNGYGGCQRPGG